jgi:hypothetical protein
VKKFFCYCALIFLPFKLLSQNDSLITKTGSGKKEKLSRSDESSFTPFKITVLTNNVNDYSMKKLSGIDGQITVVVRSETGGGVTLHGNGHIPVPVLSDLQMQEGTYTQEIPDERATAVSNKYVFMHVTFPFRAVMYFKLPGEDVNYNQSVQQLLVEVSASGNYLLNITLGD